jgi:hypothetical protein
MTDALGAEKDERLGSQNLIAECRRSRRDVALDARAIDRARRRIALLRILAAHALILASAAARLDGSESVVTNRYQLTRHRIYVSAKSDIGREATNRVAHSS